MTDHDRPLQVGDRVLIRDDREVPFSRTPGPARGRTGTIVGDRGAFGEPELVSAGHLDAPLRRLFQVALTVGDGADEVLLDVFEHWLLPADPAPADEGAVEHVDDHGHDHEHPPFEGGHDEAPAPTAPASAELVSAVLELLMDKGLLAGDEVRRKRQEIRARGLAGGARVIARAWTDPAYHERLVTDAVAAIRELGIEPLTSSQGALVALADTDDVHHVIVCTLCSCYPTAVLGQPPAWYKSEDYRRRVVERPREVLAEFGLELPATTTVRVVDSTADCRYLIVPQRPAGTETLGVDELAALVTRDCMVGVALPTAG
jgi:nitrile hydratase